MDPTDEPSTDQGAARRSFRKYLIAGVVLCALLIGFATLSGFPGQGPVIGFVIAEATDVPAAGQVWFGTAFDPGTFHVTDRMTTVKPGAKLAAVAHLTTSIGDAEAYWRLLQNDQLFQNGLLRLIRGS